MHPPDVIVLSNIRDANQSNATYELWYFLHFDANCKFLKYNLPLSAKDKQYDS